jgi:predicted short-subunit dehydrogenase-like oxidoreductase (DUF2520 family)
MEHVDGLRPARLTIGIISAGRVGTALGVALERADHVVVACSAISQASRERAQRRLPDTAVLPPDEVASRAELLLLAVPDAELAGLVSGLAATSAVRPGTIVAHTSGANGVGVLAPLTEQGCIPLAIHPAMTFTGARMPGRCTTRRWLMPAITSSPCCSTPSRRCGRRCGVRNCSVKNWSATRPAASPSG